MKKTAVGFACIVIIILLFTVSQMLNSSQLAGVASLISSQQKYLYIDCISSFSDQPLESFKVTTADLNDDSHTDAFVQYTQGEHCGNAGCALELCIAAEGSYAHIPFGYAGREVKELQTMTEGMKDLILNNDEKLKMRWNGTAYTLQ